jgi:NADH-quinone oxidoreductase subunit J
MNVDLILFFILAVIAVVSALGMLFSHNAVYSALFLIVNFGSVALLFLLLNAPFIAIVQVTVYAGAIMVLFLFVIMLLGAESTLHDPTLVWQRPVALLLGVVLLAEAGYLLLEKVGIIAISETVPAPYGSPVEVGEVLFSSYLLPFEITSVLLLVGIIGAIVLTKSENK